MLPFAVHLPQTMPRKNFVAVLFSGQYTACRLISSARTSVCSSSSVLCAFFTANPQLKQEEVSTVEGMPLSEMLKIVTYATTTSAVQWFWAAFAHIVDCLSESRRKACICPDTSIRNNIAMRRGRQLHGGAAEYLGVCVEDDRQRFPPRHARAIFATPSSAEALLQCKESLPQVLYSNLENALSPPPPITPPAAPIARVEETVEPTVEGGANPPLGVSDVAGLTPIPLCPSNSNTQQQEQCEAQDSSQARIGDSGQVAAEILK